jgi:hypothetical protein
MATACVGARAESLGGEPADPLEGDEAVTVGGVGQQSDEAAVRDKTPPTIMVAAIPAVR